MGELARFATRRRLRLVRMLPSLGAAGYLHWSKECSADDPRTIKTFHQRSSTAGTLRSFESIACCKPMLSCILMRVSQSPSGEGGLDCGDGTSCRLAETQH